MTDAQVIEMPKFDFSNVSFKTEEELEAHEKANGVSKYVEKYFKPGQYDVVITAVESLGKANKDDSWVNLIVRYQGVGEKTINGLVQVPTRDVTYGPKKTTYPFKMLKDFCKAMGHTLTVDNVGPTMKALFSRPEKLTGCNLRLNVGYSKGYVKYAGKREDGATFFVLLDRRHETVKDSSGLDLQFSDKASAEMYAGENNIQIDKYTQILGYAPSATPSTVSSEDIF